MPQATALSRDSETRTNLKLKARAQAARGTQSRIRDGCGVQVRNYILNYIETEHSRQAQYSIHKEDCTTGAGPGLPQLCRAPGRSMPAAVVSAPALLLLLP